MILLLLRGFCWLVGFVFFKVVICTCGGIYHFSACTLGGQKRALESLELEVTDGGESS